MQKQFKKFGFFGSKNTTNESDAKIDDKLVKYLYKNEAGKSQKRKSKNPGLHEGDSSVQKYKPRKHPEEEVHRHKHRKHSSESIHNRHKVKELLPQHYPSHTELYYIPPEEIKKHRKKHKHETKEKIKEVSDTKRKHKSSSSTDPKTADIRDKRKHAAEDIVKFITQHSKSKDVADNEDYQWLTKKEIFNLINNSQCLPQNASTALLKKLFVFDKQHSLQDKLDFFNVATEFSKTLSRARDDKAIVVEVEQEPNPVRKSEKVHKVKEKESTQKASKHYHRSRSRDQESKHVSEVNIIVPSLKNTKRKVSKEMDDFALKQKENEKPKLKQKSRSFVIYDYLQKESSQSKIHRHRSHSQKPSNIELIEAETQQKNRVNPERHMHCLVKNTFPIVEIPPVPIGHLEKKKKSKAFKKYYKYNHEDYEAGSETHHTLSDSNKMYQEGSEISMRESSRKRHRSRDKRHSVLKADTHVSAVLISPISEKPVMKKSQSKDGDKQSKTATRKSKIPILSTTSRMVTSIKQTLSPRSCKKNVESASTPRSERERSIKDVPVPNEKFGSTTEAAKEKISNSKAIKNQNVKSSFPKPVKGKCEIVEERPSSSKPTKSELKNKASSRPVKEKSEFPNSRTPEKEKIVAGAKEKVPQNSPVRHQVRETKPQETQKSIVNKRPGASKAGKASETFKQKRSNSVEEKIRNRTLSASPAPTFRRRSTDSSLRSSQFGSKSPSRVSTVGSGSLSKSSKKTNKTLASKSDTRLQNKQESTDEKKLCTSTKASLSNSTFGDKSLDSSSKGTSLLLTKSYKDDDKWIRWQKRKMYSDSVRRKNQKTIVPPQVVEVRFLTVSGNDNFVNEDKVVDKQEEIKPPSEAIDSGGTSPPIESKEEDTPKAEEENFFENDLPPPRIELVNNDKFYELFELPIDQALNEILHENSNFLKKDFSYSFEPEKYLSSDDLSSLNGELSFFDKKLDEWYDFTIKDDGSISEISCYHNASDQPQDNELLMKSQDHIVDSSSAPGSEESGYATINSRPISRSFFQRPDIKALLKPPPVETTLDSYCIVHIETQSSTSSGLDIKDIESKSLQTVIECSQKCIQIKMSQEEIQETENNEKQDAHVEQDTDFVGVEEKELESYDFERDDEKNCGGLSTLGIETNNESIHETKPPEEYFQKTEASSCQDRVRNEVNDEKVKRKQSDHKKKNFKSFLSCIMCFSNVE